MFKTSRRFVGYSQPPPAPIPEPLTNEFSKREVRKFVDVLPAAGAVETTLSRVRKIDCFADTKIDEVQPNVSLKTGILKVFFAGMHSREWKREGRVKDQ